MEVLARNLGGHATAMPAMPRRKIVLRAAQNERGLSEMRAGTGTGTRFYLGSIYTNYAATALTATATFLVGVFGMGWSKDVVIWACFAFTMVFPLWFFRYARSPYSVLCTEPPRARAARRIPSRAPGGFLPFTELPKNFLPVAASCQLVRHSVG